MSRYHTNTSDYRARQYFIQPNSDATKSTITRLDDKWPTGLLWWDGENKGPRKRRTPTATPTSTPDTNTNVNQLPA